MVAPSGATFFWLTLDLDSTIIKIMKHLIKWMKISAGINLYLAIIATLLLIALMVDIGLDGYWRGTTTIMYETEPSQ